MKPDQFRSALRALIESHQDHPLAQDLIEDPAAPSTIGEAIVAGADNAIAQALNEPDDAGESLAMAALGKPVDHRDIAAIYLAEREAAAAAGDEGRKLETIKLIQRRIRAKKSAVPQGWVQAKDGEYWPANRAEVTNG